ncbi:MAG TPA: glucoamylase family protein [Anaerolineae bacterium]|nr:glucoamylase family protein [Anaerolineae bacterium]
MTHDVDLTRDAERGQPDLLDLARRLAEEQRVTRRARGDANPLDRLDSIALFFARAYDHYAHLSESGELVTDTAEWILDNHYVIRQAARQVDENMPAGYYRQLPKLEGRTWEGQPRVYALARAFIEHEHRRHAAAGVEVGRLAAFLSAYQEVTPLTLGELWAVPIMLRLGLLEWLAATVARALGTEDGDRDDLSDISLPEDVPDAVLVGYGVRGLRTIAGRDWDSFVESVSHVQRLLSGDPAAIYPQMDFETRDAYRKAVEAIALHARAKEEEVAALAVELAGAGGDERQRHVGYYLVDRGQPALEAAAGLRLSLLGQVTRWLRRRALAVYIGSILLLTGLFAAAPVAYAAAAGADVLQIVGVILLVLVPIWFVAVNIVNLVATRLARPRVLPKMDYRRGVPPEHATFVVVPTLLSDEEELDSLLRQLERHYLTNRDPNFYFALLTDFDDAPEEWQPGDEELLAAARAGIADLNRRYRREGPGPFYVLHRRRVWNPSEAQCMGWERKRGKLAEFNRLLAGDTGTSYLLDPEEIEQLPSARYVVTLDADTVMPRDAVRRLVATLAHPLNRARFDPRTGRVTAGYTILQPRVEVLPTSANRSLFTRIFSPDMGLDLYTRAVSDVYQDLFGEGVFVGKGIYDVAAFERSLDGRVPENALLSHDLFEGILGRTGLVTDVVLYEDYPPGYLTYAHRMHRWVRGDWQLLPWLWFRVPGAGGKRLPNRLSALDLWKVVDNLRRSLRAPALMALLVAGWVWLPGSPIFWTVVALLTEGVPLLGGLTGQLRRGATRDVGLRVLRTDLARWALQVTFLPYEATIAFDAIVTTLVRLFVTHRHLLQWTTAAHTVRTLSRQWRIRLVWVEMRNGVFLTLLLALLVAIVNLSALLVAAPLLVLWFLSPQVAMRISRPIVVEPEVLTPAEEARLRSVARRTWLFFERFAGPDDHWLPPDHFQEDPRGLVAHRTSPTNIGLLLVSAISAYQFGYLGIMDLVVRLRSTFEGMAGLERYRGHFLNWYETRGLTTLSPRYVSTVDSGNLAGCLLALRHGLNAAAGQPILSAARWRGLCDTFDVLSEVLSPLAGLDISDLVAAPAGDLEDICQMLARVGEEPERWMPTLVDLRTRAWASLSQELAAMVASSAGRLDPLLLRNLRLWIDRLNYQLENMLTEVDLLLPWLRAMVHPPAFFARLDPGTRAAALWRELGSVLLPQVSLQSMRATTEEAGALLENLIDVVSGAPEEGALEAERWCRSLAGQLESARLAAEGILAGLDNLERQAEEYFQAADFSFLFDEQREVFYLGYRVDEERLDDNHYDLLASEARIASLIAIAKGDVPLSHWLHLDRPLTSIGNDRVLISWNGSMFEYLMPTLLMRSYPGTLLHQTYRGVVDRQIEYAHGLGVPWGISESGYYRFDAAENYQYRGFGVPRLGRKRGLDEDLVITPYASLLALPVDARAVVRNVDDLAKQGAMGHYGFYEAIDYTPRRLPLGLGSALVRSYMAHHQGMILVALANRLLDGAIVEAFHHDPRIEGVELLLQEQVPRVAIEEADEDEASGALRAVEEPAEVGWWDVAPGGPVPEALLLGNGRYRVVITAAGSGFSSWGPDVDITRWRADTTLDDWGGYIYLQDLDGVNGGGVWSATRQPAGYEPREEAVRFTAHRAEFNRRDGDISVRTEVSVPPDADVELRVVTLTNHGDLARRLRISSYAEPVLAPQDADRRHPAFNKMFIMSDYLAEEGTLLFWRRPRSDEEMPVHVAHLLALPEEEQGDPDAAAAGSFETDRARFVGRGGSLRAPAALTGRGELSGSLGATLDPVMALAQELTLPPHATTSLAYVTAAGRSREGALAQARPYRRLSAVREAMERARVQAQIAAGDLDLDTDALRRGQRILSALLYPSPALRAAPETLAANRLGQPGLWAYGISGDYPILLVCVADDQDVGVVEVLLRVHAFWRKQGIKIDLVLLNEQPVGYAQGVQEQLQRFLRHTGADAWLNQRGGVFLLRAGQMDEAAIVLLSTAARVVLDAGAAAAPLEEQLNSLSRRPMPLPAFVATDPGRVPPAPPAPVERPEGLRFDNGLGGFDRDGREYVIYLPPGVATPAPWVNVVANDARGGGFGFLASESTLGFTWAGNSGENRLTPWSNDPVRDPAEEALYLRDEETAAVWSVTPLPAPSGAPYLVRHGAGYTAFEHHSHGLDQHLRVYVAPDAPVKVARLRVENRWDRPRRITATYYAAWVLGVNRDQTQQYVITEYDPDRHALLARNPYSAEFAARVAFAASSSVPHGMTADRTEFLGRNGEPGAGPRLPAALTRVGLSGRVGAGLDPCAAIQVHLDLAPGEAEEIFFLLGQGIDREDTAALLDRFLDPVAVEEAWSAATGFWDDLLGSVQVRTPDEAMDVLLNRWLLYQDLSCRIWGRSGFYQSSGAYGFRDQLQDVMALIHAAPGIAREHILRAARHQFEAGDVLHWWHPPSGRGVRTLIRDDLLWLPYVTAHYVGATCDRGILDEEVPFIAGPPLGAEEAEHYGHFEVTEQAASLYEHCRRAIEQGTTAGRHGLPLMGGGDWNDGMNRVGIDGEGESVWLGWFLYAVLDGFAPIAEQRGEAEYAALCRERMATLRAALEQHAWDGDWYRRAFYDDGTPLGSAQNLECRIDSIAQSWAALSGAGGEERVARAMDSFDRLLVRPESRLLLLFTPPFDKTPRDPGYIKGYPPGVRENGGQYTHGALWAVWALAEMGRGDRAGELYQMLNPIYRTLTPSQVARYEVEPYVVAADIYGVAPHEGKGGWTWYTGSGGWMYRLGLEAMLGIRRVGEVLHVDPHIPSDWPSYEVSYRYRSATYHITVENPDRVSQGVVRVTVDGRVRDAADIGLVDDGQEHAVTVRMGKGRESSQ